MNYVNASEARNYFHINATTLKKWKDEGRIKFKKFSSKNFYMILIHLKPNILQNNEKMLYTHVFRIPNNLMIYKLK